MDNLVENHYHPKSRNDLRQWIKSSISSGQSKCWIIIYKKDSDLQKVDYNDVVEEAICFGLIDTQTKGVGATSYAICLRLRSPHSNWTSANQNIAEMMIEKGQMTDKGLKVFQLRKKL